MKKRQIEWDKAYYGVSCLDRKLGLPSLPYKSVDLCLTDPFYNINAGVCKGVCKGGKFKFRREGLVQIYDDCMTPEKYFIFSNLWFYYVKKICKMVVFTCGKTNLKMWYSIDDFYEGIWLIRNSSSRGYISNYIKFEPILFYGIFKKNKLLFDVIDAYVNSGFLTGKSRKKWMLHPHPKPVKLYEKILTQLKPKSVIDPFLGSGTTAEICTKLGIPWIGYELKKVFEQDLNRRLKRCKKEPKQTNLLSF